MSYNGKIDERALLFFTAGLACLVCVPVIFVAMRPVVWWFHTTWAAWLLGTLFILIPLVVTFIILYCSAWHREWSKARRILSLALSSCIIFGVDFIAVVLLLAVGTLLAG